MEASFALILYQNMLFGEGLESILNKNNVAATKFPFPYGDHSIGIPLNGSKFLLIEFNWPFMALEQFVENNKPIFNNGIRTIIIPNMVDNHVVRLIRKEKIDGVVLKSSDSEELIFAIRHVAEGKKYFSSLVTNLLLKNDNPSDECLVTKREKQILSLLADMKTTAEIAANLSISPSTVKTHRRNLLHKFKVKNIFGLLRLACSENLLSVDSDFCGYCHRQFAATRF